LCCGSHLRHLSISISIIVSSSSSSIPPSPSPYVPKRDPGCYNGDNTHADTHADSRLCSIRETRARYGRQWITEHGGNGDCVARTAALCVVCTTAPNRRVRKAIAGSHLETVFITVFLLYSLFSLVNWGAYVYLHAEYHTEDLVQTFKHPSPHGFVEYSGRQYDV